MMDEKNFRENLYKYLDGEMSESQIKEFEAFLASNPLAMIEFENEKKLDEMIRNHVIKEEAPYELREAIIDKLAHESILDKARAWYWMKPAMSGLLTFVIVLIFVVVLSSNRNQFPAFAQAVETHVDYLQGGYPFEIKTNSVDEAIAWFDGKLDFAVARPHISPQQATLIGARIIQIDGQKAAYFMYEANGRNISAFVMNLESSNMKTIGEYRIKQANDSDVYARNLKGFETVLCYHKNVKTGCMFVTDMREEEFINLLG